LAYISLIQQDWHAEAFRIGNAYQIVVNVGCDPAVGHTYSIALGLEPQPGGALEYYFYIVDIDERTDEYRACHDGRESINILPKVQRGAILRAILHATKLLAPTIRRGLSRQGRRNSKRGGHPHGPQRHHVARPLPPGGLARSSPPIGVLALVKIP
jgi:hypothetical protein